MLPAPDLAGAIHDMLTGHGLPISISDRCTTVICSGYMAPVAIAQKAAFVAFIRYDIRYFFITLLFYRLNCLFVRIEFCVHTGRDR